MASFLYAPAPRDRNRLIGVTRAYRDADNDLNETSTVATLAYDGLGRRIQKKIENSGDWDATYRYNYDGWSLLRRSSSGYEGWKLVETRDDSDDVLKQHLWGSGPGRHSLGGGGYIDELVQIAINDDPTDAGENNCETFYYALQDANYNLLGIIEDDGSLKERYEYTPYGQRTVFKSAGSDDPRAMSPLIDSQQAVMGYAHGICDVGHQGLPLDKETGLIYVRTRYLSAVLGRYMQQDALGYVDGMNLYEYVRSNANRRHDPKGLASFADIAKGYLRYSCNCGWIDWTHASEGVVKYWKAMLYDSGRESVKRRGFRVRAEMTMHKWGIAVGVYPEYFVRYGLSEPQKESVALGIFKELAWMFEEFQGNWFYAMVTESSFSEEDITSDLLGFYRDVRGVSKPRIEDACDVLDVPDSECVWKESGGRLKRYKPNWHHNHWIPKYHHTDSVTARERCKDAPKVWPCEFDAIIPSKKGELWDDWIRVVTTGTERPPATYDEHIRAP